MKILIATSFVGSWPYIPEMLDELERCGQDAEVFDIDDLGEITLAAKLAFRAPNLRYSASVALLKRRLKLFPPDFDAVNIHFAAPIYRDLARPLKQRGRKLVTSIWGSDFLRARPSTLRDLGRTLQASDIVTTNNPEIQRRLAAHYPGISERVRVVRWGLRSLDVIAGLQQSESRAQTRRKLGLPSGKVVVACGYNAIPQQRHAMIIEAFAALSPETKSRLFALFPMTYPNTPAYRDELAKQLEAAEVDYLILDGMMSLEDICRIRIASDCAVNVQTTDSLSASLQEHMFAGSSMIVGKWLPYDTFEQLGIPLQRVGSVEDISAALAKASMEIRGEYSRPHYAERLYEYSSWGSNIGKWLEIYGT